MSHNLSSHGMFIITSSPVEQGTDLQVQLQVGEEWLPLEGVVIWTRAQSEGPDRPAGFGIHLVDPSGQYLDYVKQISEAEH